jgi:hypothetical protein
MRVEVNVTLRHDEVVALLAEVAPLRIHLTEADEDRRFVELDRPSEVSFVAGQGVRIVTRGRLRHELAGVGLPFDIRRVQLMFVPEIVSGGHGYRFDFRFRVESADLEKLPGVVENVVVSKVNHALEPERSQIYWQLAQTLSVSVPLPDRFEPLDRFETRACAAQVTVTNESLILRLGLGLSLTRTRTRPTDDGSAESSGEAARRPPDQGLR